MSEQEEKIRELSEEYNSSMEELAEIESRLNGSKETSYQLLRLMYSDMKSKVTLDSKEFQELESKYAENEKELAKEYNTHYEKLLGCFARLQRLRQTQNTYLIGLINDMKKEIDSLNAKLNESNTTSTQREDNVA